MRPARKWTILEKTCTFHGGSGGKVLIASSVPAALSHRSWALEAAPGRTARCQMFLLRGGRAELTGRHQADMELTAPAMLWLPVPVRGSLRIMAGGEAFHAVVSPDMVLRAAGDPALTPHLRPLLDTIVLAGARMIAPHRAAIEACFAALVEEAQGLRPAAEAMAGLHLATLLLQLSRCTGTDQRAGAAGSAATTAQRYRQMVELHYHDALRIDEFAARMGVTRAHLHDSCLRATGRTPLALLHERLLAEARARLEQTGLSVEQVGYSLGFRDAGYFSRFFKRLSGESPGAYRRAAARSAPPPAPSFAAWP
jgi:AraC family transcriptional activator of pobA